MFFFSDEEAPINAIKVYKVNNLFECKDAIDNLKFLKSNAEEASKRKDNKIDIDSITDAIEEQERQIHIFSSKYDYNNKKLRDNIELLLKKNNMQINTLEAILELSAGYISRTLGIDSKKKLSIDVVYKIARIFNVNIDDLLTINFTEPTNDMRKVIKFIMQLKDDVDKEREHWKRIDSSNNNTLFFKKNNNEMVYEPVGEGAYISSVDEIYMLDTKIGALYLVKGFGPFEEETYEIYHFDEETYNMTAGTEYESKYALTLVTESFLETSGLIKANCEKLYKAIKIHEYDFTISNEARSVIDKFMADVLPF